MIELPNLVSFEFWKLGFVCDLALEIWSLLPS